MNERLQLLLQVLDPLDSEQMLKGGVVPWVGDVWECVVGQELISLAQLRTLRIQELFEFSLRVLEVLIWVFPWLVGTDVRVLDVHDEVDLEVKFELLVREILLFHVWRNKRIEDLEEFGLISAVKVVLDLEEHLLRVDCILLHAPG